MYIYLPICFSISLFKDRCFQLSLTGKKKILEQELDLFFTTPNEKGRRRPFNSRKTISETWEKTAHHTSDQDSLYIYIYILSLRQSSDKATTPIQRDPRKQMIPYTNLCINQCIILLYFWFGFVSYLIRMQMWMHSLKKVRALWIFQGPKKRKSYEGGMTRREMWVCMYGAWRAHEIEWWASCHWYFHLIPSINTIKICTQYFFIVIYFNLIFFLLTYIIYIVIIL